MYLLINFRKLTCSIARHAVLEGGVTLIIFLLMISLVCLILYIIISNKDK